MDDPFIAQFLAATWRLVVFILILLGIAAFIIIRGRNQKQKDIRRQKEALSNKGNKSQSSKSSKKRPNSKKQRRPRPEVEVAEPIVTAPEPDDDFQLGYGSGSIFDDEELFGDDTEAEAPVPVVQEKAMVEATPIHTEDNQEEEVDLASLLVGMVEDVETSKDYHMIADTPIGIMLASGIPTVANELLSIQRDLRDSRLMVQIDDTAYRTLRDDKDAKQTFAKIMQELAQIVTTPDDGAETPVDVSGVKPHKMIPDPINVLVSSGGDTIAREMMSISRDTADGHLIVQMGKKGYRTLADKPKIKAGFSKIMKELATVIVEADDNPPIVPQQSVKAQPTSTQPSSTTENDDDEVLPGDIRIKSMDEMPVSYVIGRFGQVKVQDVEEKVEELNIPDAINKYLQYKIAQTPAYQDRGIKISSSFSGAVQITVDGELYEFVDEIKDRDAQAFIKQAIDEWQSRH